MYYVTSCLFRPRSLEAANSLSTGFYTWITHIAQDLDDEEYRSKYLLSAVVALPPASSPTSFWLIRGLQLSRDLLMMQRSKRRELQVFIINNLQIQTEHGGVECIFGKSPFTFSHLQYFAPFSTSNHQQLLSTVCASDIGFQFSLFLLLSCSLQFHLLIGQSSRKVELRCQGIRESFPFGCIIISSSNFEIWANEHRKL